MLIRSKYDEFKKEEKKNRQIIEIFGHEFFQEIKILSNKFLINKVGLIITSIRLYEKLRKFQSNGFQIAIVKDNEKVIQVIKI